MFSTLNQSAKQLRCWILCQLDQAIDERHGTEDFARCRKRIHQGLDGSWGKESWGLPYSLVHASKEYGVLAGESHNQDWHLHVAESNQCSFKFLSGVPLRFSRSGYWCGTFRLDEDLLRTFNQREAECRTLADLWKQNLGRDCWQDA